ncbi:glutamate synthase central domain-containing protein, partial [Bacillus mycoides]|uniref:glutamate synthase central domain-containing protein n=1 Tax=Bacillus mycoides TaxID=1405 RepID=UPI003CC7CFAD
MPPKPRQPVPSLPHHPPLPPLHPETTNIPHFIKETLPLLTNPPIHPHTQLQHFSTPTLLPQPPTLLPPQHQTFLTHLLSPIILQPHLPQSISQHLQTISYE